MKLTAAAVSGIVAGILDMSAAIIVYDFIMGLTTPGNICRSVAGGIYGKAAAEGGTSVAVTGLALHFLIAIIFAFIYVYAFRNIIRKITKNILLTGIIYGCLVWLAMNYAVMPLSAYGHVSHFKAFKGLAISLGIIILCVGISIAFVSEKILRKVES